MKGSFEERRDEWLRGQEDFLNGNGIQKRGEIVRPVPWAAQIDKPSDLSREMKRGLSDLVEAVKTCHFKGTSQAWRVTRSDINHLLRHVFANEWHSGDYHELAPVEFEPGLEDVGVLVGTLRHTLRRPSLDGFRISKPTVQRGQSVTTGPGRSGNPLRKRGASVWLRTKPVAGMLTFKFYDGGNRPIPLIYGAKDVVDMPTGAALVGIKAQLMQMSDHFRIKHAGCYNVRLAVWLARNRINLWANKGSVSWLPRRAKDGRTHFLYYDLSQNLLCPAELRDAQARLLAISRPDVFSLIQLDNVAVKKEEPSTGTKPMAVEASAEATRDGTARSKSGLSKDGFSSDGMERVSGRDHGATDKATDVTSTALSATDTERKDWFPGN